jgi:cytochrome c oxidase assembly protein subunit 11
MSALPQEPTLQQQNRQMLFKLLVIVVGMLGFCYSLIPMYRQICEVLGINQTRVVVSGDGSWAGNTQIDYSREVTMELTSNIVGGLPWRFEPLQKQVTFHPGQMVEVTYRVTNTLDRDIVAQAKPSFAPDYAGRHVTKAVCFCFENQSFKAGETRDLPVVFIVDSELPKSVQRVSMSYTFFDVASIGGSARPASHTRPS